MKSRISKSIYNVALLSVLALAGAAFFTPARGATADTRARKLEGTWRTQVTIRNCQTGDAIRTFPALVTFAKGGTLNATTAGFSPARVSPDYGIWRHTGGRTYSAVSEAFLFSPAGDWIATQRVTRTIEISEDPDELNATTSTEIFAPDGNLVSTGCATAIGRRME